jgi:HNH endonuclease
MQSKKRDQGFQDLLVKHAKLDDSTGHIDFGDLYASMYFNIGWSGSIVSVPVSHVVWFLHTGRWPEEGMHVDHKNDNPCDNRPCNLQEFTPEQNAAKKRNRKTNRNYGTGKYGFGFSVGHDKRDSRYYITKFLSRGQHKAEGVTKRIGLGGFETLPEAEEKVRFYIEETKRRGIEWVPEAVPARAKKVSIDLMHDTQRIRALRAEGRNLAEIAALTGYSPVSIYNKTKDMPQGRKTSNTGMRNIDMHHGTYRVRVVRKGKTVFHRTCASLQEAQQHRDAFFKGDCS